MIDSRRTFAADERDWVRAKLAGIKDEQIVRASSVVGYCRCDRHKGKLTAPLMHSHRCLEKDCPFLERYVEYPYWKEKAAAEKAKAGRKAEARAGKAARKAAAKAESAALEEAMEALKAKAQAAADALGMDILITRAAPCGNGRSFVINYVSADPEDAGRKYADLGRALAQDAPGWYEIRRMRLPDGTPATPESYRAMLKRK